MRIIRAVHVSDLDNCVTLTDSVVGGDMVGFTEGGGEKAFASLGDIPKWHKMAIKDIKKGGVIYKYGAVVGIASDNIKAGECVHVHNMRSPEIGG